MLFKQFVDLIYLINTKDKHSQFWSGLSEVAVTDLLYLAPFSRPLSSPQWHDDLGSGESYGGTPSCNDASHKPLQSHAV